MAARKGRPPRDPNAGPPSFHVGLRFDQRRGEMILRLVADANKRAVDHGIPANVSASSLAYMWISERLEEEIAKLERRKK